MWQYIVRRLLGAVPTALAVVTAVFLALRLLPGDPAVAALGDFASAAQIESYREQMGLNDPLHVQYLEFLSGLLTGNFGVSLANNTPIAQLLLANLPFTLELTVGATILSILIGLPLGILAALRRRTVIDYGSRIFALSGLSVPDFYLGALLLILFGLVLQWFPLLGAGGPGLLDRLHHLVLPSLTLGLIMGAFIMRLARSSILEVLNKDYIRTARSKGISERSVTYKHALRNALIPILTGLGIYILAALSGSITIELVFSRPGLGRLLIGAISSRDYPVIQAGLVVFSLFVVLINLAVDILYAVIDPRIEYA